MPRYHVIVNFSRRTKDAPDAFSREVEAADPIAAERAVVSMAKAHYPRCRHGVVEVDELVETTDSERHAEFDAFAMAAEPDMGDPAPMPGAALRYLTDDQRLAIAALAKSLPERSGTRLALELALHTDAEARPQAEHDFGPHGSARYCKRPECQARNQLPVNRWGCKGAA